MRGGVRSFVQLDSRVFGGIRQRSAPVTLTLALALAAAATAQPPRDSAPRMPDFVQTEMDMTPKRLLAKAKASELFDDVASAWRDPVQILATNNVIDTTLRVGYAKNTIADDGAMNTVCLRSYHDPTTGEGLVTGPTLRFKASDAGKRLRVLLRNDLPCNGVSPDPASCSPQTCQPKECKFTHNHASGDPNDPRNFWPNVTNFHTHGWHVSPQAPQDNVLLSVEPGCSYQVDVQVPADHFPGTFWYHAHWHGGTGMQVASGMAGALIIEGDIDEVPEIKSAEERIFVLQQVYYNNQGLIESFDDLFGLKNPRPTTINGQLKPRIEMQPGEVERWRFVNAAYFEVLPLRIVSATTRTQVPLNLISLDSVTLKRLAPIEVVELGPGNRADVLIKAPAAAGTYWLIKSEAARVAGEVEPMQILAEIVVAGALKNDPLPTTLPTSLVPKAISDAEVSGAKERRLTFSVDKTNRDPTGKPRFLINGKRFDPEVVNQDPKLGTVEVWTIENASTQNHPFHIHVNPFQITEYTTIEGGRQKVISVPEAERVWHDTFLIPKATADVPNCDGANKEKCGSFKFRMRFEDFDGKFVLHCHVLTHEDVGMMEVVEIRP
jgi:FtsP/CotA-like multicopper oxidase with cupredoxin domain